MNLKDVMRQIAEDFDIPEEVIQNAFKRANSLAAPGPETQKILERELPDEVAVAWKAYGSFIILKCLTDPDFKKEFFEKSVNEAIARQAEQN